MRILDLNNMNFNKEAWRAISKVEFIKGIKNNKSLQRIILTQLELSEVGIIIKDVNILVKVSNLTPLLST